MHGVGLQLCQWADSAGSAGLPGALPRRPSSCQILTDTSADCRHTLVPSARCKRLSTDSSPSRLLRAPRSAQRRGAAGAPSRTCVPCLKRGAGRKVGACTPRCPRNTAPVHEPPSRCRSISSSQSPKSQDVARMRVHAAIGTRTRVPASPHAELRAGSWHAIAGAQAPVLSRITTAAPPPACFPLIPPAAGPAHDCRLGQRHAASMGAEAPAGTHRTALTGSDEPLKEHRANCLWGCALLEQIRRLAIAPRPRGKAGWPSREHLRPTLGPCHNKDTPALGGNPGCRSGEPPLPFNQEWVEFYCPPDDDVLS